MNKKIVVICSSPRKGGNSEILADMFIKGALEAGHLVEKVRLADYQIGYCKACYYCREHLACCQKDDVNPLMEKLLAADVVVFATPVYFFEMSGQLKVFLDRTMPVYFSEYHFHDVYLLATSLEEAKTSMDGAIKGVQGWIDCFEGSRLAGIVYGTGAGLPGTVKETEAVREAYELGSKI